MKKQKYEQCSVIYFEEIKSFLKTMTFLFSNSPKPGENCEKYLSFNEDKMCFVDKVIVMNDVNFNMVVGCIYRIT
jgi:hypothetical protein